MKDEMGVRECGSGGVRSSLTAANPRSSRAEPACRRRSRGNSPERLLLPREASRAALRPRIRLRVTRHALRTAGVGGTLPQKGSPHWTAHASRIKPSCQRAKADFSYSGLSRSRSAGLVPASQHRGRPFRNPADLPHAGEGDVPSSPPGRRLQADTLPPHRASRLVRRHLDGPLLLRLCHSRAPGPPVRGRTVVGRPAVGDGAAGGCPHSKEA